MEDQMQHESTDRIATPTEQRESKEDVGRNPSLNPTLGDVINYRFSRRSMLTGSLGVAAIAATVSPAALFTASPVKAKTASSFDFDEIDIAIGETHFVAPGYDAQVLLRWGDKVFAGAPEFNPLQQTAAAQLQQFGYNNDYVGFVPLDGSSVRGLLVVNHEYTNAELMFPNWAKIGKDKDGKDTVEWGEHTAELVAIEMAAHGGTVIEIARSGGSWVPVLDSKFNRRLHVGTEMEMTGPAAGHARLKTKADPTGTKVLGTINNCAGGITPWGTWLMAEENFNGYFSGELPADNGEAANHKRYGVPAGDYKWAAFHDRFDVSKEPNEANRFGWVVEVDPLDPVSTPKKRTALGRMKHEGAESLVNKDGRVVFYCGDDERFDYVYKFVTRGTFNANDRAANANLLDDGTLYAARFNADGSLEWLPLEFGQAGLTPANGFHSQADVLIETRRAADLLGATKMDRPEDVQPNPKTGKVYCLLTNNTKRKKGEEDAANPRAENAFGHIIEINETDGDFASIHSKWEILLKCGDPSVAEVGATFSTATTKNGWFGMPDNCVVDKDGRLWIATDGNDEKKTGRTDGLWAVETEGAMRGTSKLFFRVPIGAEMCGPHFVPNDETLFLAVQHPGDAGLSTYEQPATRWPDFRSDMPTRPAVIAVTKQSGGKIA
jgi:uncharacterized protein